MPLYVATDSLAVDLEKLTSRGIGMLFQRLGLCQRLLVEISTSQPLEPLQARGGGFDI